MDDDNTATEEYQIPQDEVETGIRIMYAMEVLEWLKKQPKD